MIARAATIPRGTTILDLLQEDGFNLRPKPGTAGREFCGPCFRCGGGDDRFIVWAGEGRWWCRECGGRGGDAIDYLMEHRGMQFKQALALANKRRSPCLPSSTLSIPAVSASASTPTSPVREIMSPKSNTEQTQRWQQQALAFVETAHRNLIDMADDGWDADGFAGADNSTAYVRPWLERRGLTTETIERAKLGWIGTRLFVDREAWGLPDEKGKDKILFPAGLLIPTFNDRGEVIRLRVRLKHPTDGKRYRLVAGSSPVPMVIGSERHPVVIVTESELDGLLLEQEAADLATVVALGSSSIRPDAGTDELLRRADLVLVALDNDDPGWRGTAWWLEHYPNARPWFPAGGKDPGEMVENGVDVREWIKSAVDRLVSGAPMNPSCTSPVEIEVAETAPVESPWPPETQSVIDFFLALPVPTEPFNPAPHCRVVDPVKYFEAIRRDIEVGPQGPRARTGALQAELRELKENFAKHETLRERERS